MVRVPNFSSLGLFPLPLISGGGPEFPLDLLSLVKCSSYADASIAVNSRQLSNQATHFLATFGGSNQLYRR